MALFLIDHQKDNLIYFDPKVSHHIVRSLRKRPGDTIHATDGAGTIFSARIEAGSGELVEANILRKEFIPKNWEVHVACSLIKKDSRFEYFLEKATETGVHHIIPLICERTFKQKLREDRARKIIHSAVQQSFNPYVPTLDPLVSFETYINQTENTDHERFIATSIGRDQEGLLEQQYSGRKPVHILIGPEGDFTPKEVNIAIRAGWKPVSLGSNRLRTETAATMVVQMVKSCYHMKNKTPR